MKKVTVTLLREEDSRPVEKVHLVDDGSLSNPTAGDFKVLKIYSTEGIIVYNFKRVESYKIEPYYEKS